MVPHRHALLRPLEGILCWLLLSCLLALVGAVVTRPKWAGSVEIAMSLSGADLAQGLKMTHVALVAYPLVMLLDLEIKYSTPVEERNDGRTTNMGGSERAEPKQIIPINHIICYLSITFL